MSFESITLGILTGSAPVTAICPATKIYFGTTPRDVSPPFVLCSRISTIPTLSTDNGAAGSSRLDHITLQATCFARTQEQAINLADAVRTALEGASAMEYFLSDIRSDYEDFPDAHGQFATFSCWYPTQLPT